MFLSVINSVVNCSGNTKAQLGRRERNRVPKSGKNVNFKNDMRSLSVENN